MKIHLNPFSISPLNTHYDGTYTEQMKQWRRLGAKDKSNNIRSLTGSRQFQSILEVGCGTGSVLAQISQHHLAERYCGIDMADPNLHRDETASEIELLQYDGTRTPFKDKSFDLVFATHVVEHVPDPRGFIAELARVAREYVYIEVPCELNIRVSQKKLQLSVDTGHINLYTPESFLLLLQTSNLQVELLELFDHSLDVLSFPNSPVKGLMLKAARTSLLKFSPILASRVFTYHCGALCRVA